MINTNCLEVAGFFGAQDQFGARLGHVIWSSPAWVPDDECFDFQRLMGSFSEWDLSLLRLNHLPLQRRKWEFFLGQSKIQPHS